MVRPASTKSGQKRKRGATAEKPAKKAKKPSRNEVEELDEDFDSDAVVSEGEESDDDDRETAAQKRVRLAQMYLDQLSKSKRRGWLATSSLCVLMR
jgi:hypothetical protein